MLVELIPSQVNFGLLKSCSEETLT